MKSNDAVVLTKYKSMELAPERIILNLFKKARKQSMQERVKFTTLKLKCLLLADYC
jgi:hypothetical protein